MSEFSSPPVAPTKPRTVRERQYAARIKFLENQLAQATADIQAARQMIAEHGKNVEATVSDAFALIHAQIEYDNNSGGTH